MAKKTVIVFSNDLKNALYQRSQDVGFEMPGAGNLAIAEVCLDSLEYIYKREVGQRAAAEVTELIAKYSYGKVLKEAAKHVASC